MKSGMMPAIVPGPAGFGGSRLAAATQCAGTGVTLWGNSAVEAEREKKGRETDRKNPYRLCFHTSGLCRKHTAFF